MMSKTYRDMYNKMGSIDFYDKNLNHYIEGRDGDILIFSKTGQLLTTLKKGKKNENKYKLKEFNLLEKI